MTSNKYLTWHNPWKLLLWAILLGPLVLVLSLGILISMRLDWLAILIGVGLIIILIFAYAIYVFLDENTGFFSNLHERAIKWKRARNNEPYRE